MGSIGCRRVQVEGRARYGPVWRVPFGPVVSVYVAEAALIEEVLRQEGPQPVRSHLNPWKEHRALRGHSRGLLTAEGSEWQRQRSLLSRLLLRPRAAESFVAALSGVAEDLGQRLQRVRDRNPQRIVTDIGAELCAFGLEGIAAVLFGCRLGCLQPEVPVPTLRFLRSTRAVSGGTLLALAMPPPLRRLCPGPWRSFCAAWDDMFEFAQAQLEARGAGGAPGCITEQLLQLGVTARDVHGCVTELLQAGVDTTSCALSWCLYELARHPWVQDALRTEMSSTPGGALSRAVLKETLRLYPVIPGNARVVPNRDIVVGGFVVPRQTLITLCHYSTSRDGGSFPSPDSFRPERWLRLRPAPPPDPAAPPAHTEPPPPPPHPFASLPFGVGKRSCVGRRLAELQIRLALEQILQRFDVRLAPGSVPVRPMTGTLLEPAGRVSLQLLPR